MFTTAPGGHVYYATGDLVARDDTGTLTFCGRVDRLLKVRGYRVQPEEVEHVLEQRAEIAEVAVVKYPSGGSDALAAVVRLTDGSRLDRARS